MKVTNQRIVLDGNELATAIDAYLTARSIAVGGPRTIRLVVNCETVPLSDVDAVNIYVDPSGRTYVNDEEPREVFEP